MYEVCFKNESKVYIMEQSMNGDVSQLESLLWSAWWIDKIVCSIEDHFVNNTDHTTCLHLSIPRTSHIKWWKADDENGAALMVC